MTTQYLPSTLPLLPLPPPQVLFPYLRVSLSLSSAQLNVVLKAIADNARIQKLEDSVKLLAVVPVVEIERRVGRWATAARVIKIEKSRTEEGMYRVVLEGLVSHPMCLGLTDRLGSDYLDRCLQSCQYYLRSLCRFRPSHYLSPMAYKNQSFFRSHKPCCRNSFMPA